MMWAVYWFFFFVVLGMLGSFIYFVCTSVETRGASFDEKVEKWWDWFIHLI